MTLTIGIVAGEVSGDNLGADLMAQLTAIYPNSRFIGVGGDKMHVQNLSPLIDINRLSVMGLTEVIKHLPDLWLAKTQILKAFDEACIDLFIGIDAPDFNLRLAKTLKPKGVFCVQYVSPSIWAWRENRIHAIKQATDLVLCLFPFELPIYQKHHHPAVCVGHPLIHTLHPPKDKKSFKNNYLNQLNLPKTPLINLMAGSRNSEIKAILPLLLQSFAQILTTQPNAHALLPLAKPEHISTVQSLIDKTTPHLRYKISILSDSDFKYLSPSHQAAHHQPWDKNYSPSQMAMILSDISLIASGTATLEALLLNAPMVVVYQVHPITFALAKRLVKTPFIALPNILSQHLWHKPIVCEYLQDNATADTIATAALTLLNQNGQQRQEQKTALKQLSEQLTTASTANPATAIVTAYHSQKT